MTITRTAVTAMVVAMALSSCVRVTSDTTLFDDNTYSQHLIIAVDPAVISQFAGEIPEGLDVLALTDSFADQDSTNDAVTVADYVEGSLEGIEVTLDRLPLADMNAIAAQVGSEFGGVAAVERVGDEYVVTIVTPETADADMTDAFDADLLSGLGLAGDSINIAITYTFPGLVRTASHGVVEGKTVTLSLTDLSAGEDIVIVGGAQPEIFWDPIVRWGLFALALIVIVGGATLLVLQDRRRRATTHLPPAQDTSANPGVGTLR